MTLWFKPTETLRIPLSIAPPEDALEDTSFTVSIYFPSNVGTTPDETYDYTTNPTNFLKIGTGSYDFIRATTLSDEEGIWVTEFNFTLALSLTPLAVSETLLLSDEFGFDTDIAPILPITLSPTLNTIKIVRGDDVTIQATLLDGNGDPLNLTGLTVTMTVKRSWGADAANIVIQKDATLIAPLLGQIEFTFTEDETRPITPKIYVYDIQLNSGFDITTFLNAKAFVVLEDVTNN